MTGASTQKGLAILGSTGSIGLNTLDIVRRHPERFRVVTLSAGNNIDLLKAQIEEFKPAFVSVLSRDGAVAIKTGGRGALDTGYGVDGVCAAASHEGVQMVVSAVSGAAGLLPTMSAIRAGKDIALANKETLVLAGSLVMDEVKTRGVRLMPVDSEHSAVFQSLVGQRKEDVRRIILTASGGPFLDLPVDEFAFITPERALRHPKWSMGRKITVDSATLVNKGLEVIEAYWLFGVESEKISVVIHPQSIVHSMVEYKDSSIVSQMSSPDMRGPIAYALGFPERIDAGIKPLTLAGSSLEFREPDSKRFPCLALSYEALRICGTMPAVMNAADEVAVEMFLKGALPFNGIYKVIAETMQRHSVAGVNSIDDVIAADAWARGCASAIAAV